MGTGERFLGCRVALIATWLLLRELICVYEYGVGGQAPFLLRLTQPYRCKRGGEGLPVLFFLFVFRATARGLAAGTGEGWVLVFSRSGASTGEKWALNTIVKPHSGPIFRIVRSPNGDIFASCSDDSTVALWEIGRHQKPIKLQSRFAEAVYDIAFSADGRVLAATGRDRIIQTWSVSRSRTSQSLTAQHGPQGDIVKAVPARIINVKNAVIRSLSYSPDGAFLAAGAYGSEDQATTQKRLILVRFLLCKHTCPRVVQNITLYPYLGTDLRCKKLTFEDETVCSCRSHYVAFVFSRLFDAS